MIQSLKCRIGLHKFEVRDALLAYWRALKGENPDAPVPVNIVRQECIHCHKVRYWRLGS